MKAVLAIVLGSFISSSMAQEVVIAANADIALKSCQEKSAASPKELQEQMLKSCRCIVEHTDFDKANQLNNEGKSAELKALYDKAVKACSNETNASTTRPDKVNADKADADQSPSDTPNSGNHSSDNSSEKLG